MPSAAIGPRPRRPAASNDAGGCPCSRQSQAGRPSVPPDAAQAVPEHADELVRSDRAAGMDGGNVRQSLRKDCPLAALLATAPSANPQIDPDRGAFVVSVTFLSGAWTVGAETIGAARCPSCGRFSTSPYSSYRRSLSDLPSHPQVAQCQPDCILCHAPRLTQANSKALHENRECVRALDIQTGLKTTIFSWVISRIVHGMPPMP